jgi:hypothetical protein
MAPLCSYPKKRDYDGPLLGGDRTRPQVVARPIAGRARSVGQIARRERVAARYVKALMPLGFLGPKI